LHRADVGERRVDRHVGGVVVLARQFVHQLLDERRRLEVVEVHLPVTADQRLAGGVSHGGGPPTRGWRSSTGGEAMGSTRARLRSWVPDPEPMTSTRRKRNP